MTKIEYKAGQRVILHAEGVVSDDYATDSEDDVIRINTGNLDYVYVEVGHRLEPYIEVVKEPLKDGLYYYANHHEPVSKMSLVYKLKGGKWHDFNLEEVELDEDEIALMVPLVRGEA